MNKKSGRVIALLWIGAILVNIKGIFADFGPDQGYAIATSYRHLLCDGMFNEMWEPHQTSSFLSDIGMWIYHLFVPSYEYVALFMQLFGVLFYALITFVLLKVLEKHYDKKLCHFICIIFFTYRAKLMVYPEFSNMHICFSVLLFLCLLEYFSDQKKYIKLILAALCMCLLVLSYPSCLITFIGIIVCLYIFSEKKWKSIGIFTGVCVFAGLIYISYFVINIGLESFVFNLRHIFTSDASHTSTVFSASVFFKGTIRGLLWMAFISIISLGISKWRKKSFYVLFVLGTIISDIILMYVAQFNKADWTTTFFIINPLLMILAAFNIKKTDYNTKRMWIVSMVISGSSAIAVLLLTNQEFLSIFAYMILGTIISLVPLSNTAFCEKEKTDSFFGIISLLCLFIIIHRGLSVYGYINVEKKYVVTSVENIVRCGPTKGIVTSLSECNEARYSMEDWKANTLPGETVLLVDEGAYDPIVYLYNNNNVAAYSTIDTPVYDESLITYWEKYEEKKPTVIAVKSWDGKENLDPREWFSQYIIENYDLVEVGTFFTFYRIKE